MKANEINGMISQHVVDDARVWLFVHDGHNLRRLCIGFNSIELLGMSALAPHEICQLMGGDKSLSPTPVERLVPAKDMDTE